MALYSATCKRYEQLATLIWYVTLYVMEIRCSFRGTWSLTYWTFPYQLMNYNELGKKCLE